MSDVFRKSYKTLSQENSQKITDMKEQAEKLYNLMDVNSREMAVAKTNLEQAMMWATKAVVLHDEKSSEMWIAGAIPALRHLIKEKQMSEERNNKLQDECTEASTKISNMIIQQVVSMNKIISEKFKSSDEEDTCALLSILQRIAINMSSTLAINAEKRVGAPHEFSITLVANRALEVIKKNTAVEFKEEPSH